jgi:hypothetical protein
MLLRVQRATTTERARARASAMASTRIALNREPHRTAAVSVGGEAPLTGGVARLETRKRR